MTTHLTKIWWDLNKHKLVEQAIPEAEIYKREWVGLTDEERHNIRDWQEIQKELGPVWAPMMLYLYLAIEQALKEKNDG